MTKRFVISKISRALLVVLGLFSVINADPLLDAANQALDAGNYRKAEFLYQQALKAGANEAIIDYNLAIVNYRMDKISEAIRYFKKVTELAPLFKDSYLNLGRIYFSLEAYVDSLKAFLDFLDRDPADEETLLLAGDVFKKLSLFREAEEYYTKALDLRATNADPHLAMASLYLDLGDQEKALALLDRAVRK
ncbi:MAG: tetratricopeptide repeat protein, partial [Spirochaetia bacterium]|nr:tetratricopeptide repeat protein [Spirochaetia bacterium]